MGRSSNPALDRAIAESETLVNKALMWLNTKKVYTWAELEKMAGITIEPQFKALPFNYMMIQGVWGKAWITGTEARMLSSVEGTIEKIKYADVEPKKYGDFTLFREQQATTNALIHRLKDKGLNAVLVNAKPGWGKTPAAVATAYEYLKNTPKSTYGHTRVIVVTVSSVVEDFKDHFRQMGLQEELDTGIIFVYGYQQLITEGILGMYCSVESVYDDQQDKAIEVWKANPVVQPEIWIFDESQSVNRWNSKRAKFCFAIADIEPPWPKPKIIFQSATAFVVPNDARNFVLAAKIRYNGALVTSGTFAQFARLICKGGDPSKKNAEAMRRLRKALGDHVIDAPNVKWPANTYNTVLPVSFANDIDRETYQQAEEIFIQFLKNSGKAGKDDIVELNYLTQLIIFCSAAEPAHVEAMLPFVLEQISKKRYVLLGFEHREALVRMVMALERSGYNRSKFSIIWGGGDEIKPELVLTDEETFALARKQMRGEQLTKKDMRRIKMTAMYLADRARNRDVSEADQHARLARMKSLGLYRPQSREERQLEKNRFRDGYTIGCLCTIASGGVGLSLDHSKYASRDRVSVCTPIYSPHKFAQFFGRGLRRTTLTDIYQFCCVLRGTIEEQHVGPVLDKSLLSMNAFSGASFMQIMHELQESVVNGAHNRVRSIEEAKKEAELIDPDEFTPVIDTGDEDTGDDDDD